METSCAIDFHFRRDAIAEIGLNDWGRTLNNQ
jgi:hypothetical protein